MRFGVTAAGDRAAVLCREMTEGDCGAVVPLLTAGFQPWRNAAFWARALRRLVERTPPQGLPKFGYVLEADAAVVGVLLVLGAEVGGIRRCNVSSWYVAPEFRPYAPLLVRQALRRRDVTVLNVTPAPETRALLAAQGYRQYVSGRAFAVPALARPGLHGRVMPVGGGGESGPDLPADEATLLRDHTEWGCASVVVETAQGREPFVFGLRRRRGVLPFAYLLYCRDLQRFAACARPLGRHLLMRHGVGLVVADADERLPGMPGSFQDGFPKFYRGDNPPRPGDLAYTERAVFGV